MQLLQVDVPGNTWKLHVAPQKGWIPVWRDPMLATVIVVGLFIGALIFATLVSRCMQKWMLAEMQVRGTAGWLAGGQGSDGVGRMEPAAADVAGWHGTFAQ